MTASPAVLLREAASKMRELAQAATPGPWRALCDGYGDTSGGTAEHERRDLLWVRHGDTNVGDVVSTYGNWNARSEADVLHIAAWHPEVALAVADWLDHAAARAECKIANGGGEGPVWSHEHDALSVARVYLGRTDE